MKGFLDETCRPVVYGWCWIMALNVCPSHVLVLWGAFGTMVLDMIISAIDLLRRHLHLGLLFYDLELLLEHTNTTHIRHEVVQDLWCMFGGRYLPGIQYLEGTQANLLQFDDRGSVVEVHMFDGEPCIAFSDKQVLLCARRNDTFEIPWGRQWLRCRECVDKLIHGWWVASTLYNVKCMGNVCCGLVITNVANWHIQPDMINR